MLDYFFVVYYVGDGGCDFVEDVVGGIDGFFVCGKGVGEGFDCFEMGVDDWYWNYLDVVLDVGWEGGYFGEDVLVCWVGYDLGLSMFGVVVWVDDYYGGIEVFEEVLVWVGDSE